MSVEIKNLDHLRLIAGIIDEIGIVDQINGLIEEKKTEKVSAGKVVKVMIRTYAGTLYIAYCRHEILHTIISFFPDRYYF